VSVSAMRRGSLSGRLSPFFCAFCVLTLIVYKDLIYIIKPAYSQLFFYFAGVADLGGRLFIVGGNDGTAFLNTCEVYDPISDRWSHIAPMNTARAGIGCAVQDGILYAAGKVILKLVLVLF